MIPKISVIIPSYNTAQYICEAIDSVFVQTYKDFEIIVIDDGSKDSTQKILSQYGNKIKYIYQENRGVSAARNRGIHEAQGEYIAFLDADDSWFPDKLMKQFSIAELNPDIALFFSDTEFFNKEGLLKHSSRFSQVAQYEKGSLRDKIANVTFNDGSIFKGDFYKDLLIGDLIILSTVFIRKKCLDKTGYFDEKLYIAEDYDLWMRIARKYFLLYFNNITTRYRLSDNSSSGKLNLRNYYYAEHDAEVLKKQLHDCPKPHKNFIKKRILESYKSVVWAHYNLRDFKKVRIFCLRSLSFDKFQMKLYLYLLATFIPVGILKSRTPLKP